MDSGKKPRYTSPQMYADELCLAALLAASNIETIVDTGEEIPWN